MLPEDPNFKRNKYPRANKNTSDAAKSKTETCAYCGERPPSTLDHILPLKKHWEAGGLNLSRLQRGKEINDLENLIGACLPCNAAKGARELGRGAGQFWPKAWKDQWWLFGGP